eukprot:scaffold39200_cov30-Attheya_sp.AAC.1
MFSHKTRRSLDRKRRSQSLTISPKKLNNRNRFSRAGPTLLEHNSQSLVHDTCISSWTHAGNTLVTGNSEETSFDTYASAQRLIESSKEQSNRLAHDDCTLLSVNSKLLAHDTNSSELTRAETTLVTGGSESTALDTDASTSSFSFTESRFNEEYSSKSSESTSQSNGSYLKPGSDESGSLYLPSIDSDSDNESHFFVDSNSDSTFNSSPLNFPALKSKTSAEFTSLYYILPSYDVDPYMFIAFEISDPKTKLKCGDVSTHLSIDRVKSGIIKYVLVIPIFKRTIYLKRDAHTDCHY